jgi:probable F420-dependent oxidoreductase
VGLRYSLTAFGFEAGEYAPLAVRAEQEGFDTIWLGDHLITPAGYRSDYPYSPTGGPGHALDTPILDVWVNLGQLAARTSTLRLATGVLIAPLRSPVATARAAASAQLVSDGRIVLGLGAGWLREEFDAVGVPFAERGRRLEETIEILRLLWTGEPVRHDGAIFRFDEVLLVPKPEPAIPIVLGGLSDPACRRAARLCDGWYGPACSLAETSAARDRVNAERAAAGRGDRPFSFHARVELPLDRDRVLRYLDAGFDDLVVTGAKLVDRRRPLRDKLDALARAGEAFRSAEAG